MNITIVTPFYYPDINGISNLVQLNVIALIELGYSVNIVSKKGTRNRFNEKVLTFSCYGNGTILNKVRGKDIDLMVTEVINLSKESELILLHGWHSWASNLILDNSKKLHCKLILYSHGTSFFNQRHFLISAIRCANYLPEIIKFKSRLNSINALISITDFENHYRCQDIVKVDKRKLYLLHNTIRNRYENNVAKFDNNSYYEFFSDGNKISLCISNFEQIKNQLYLLKLVKKYKFKIIFVGSSETKYLTLLKKYVHKYQLQNFVLFKIAISDIETDWLLGNCHFFLFSSKNDFCPLVLIESIKYSLPFISFYTADNKLRGGYFATNEAEFEICLINYLNLDFDSLRKIGNEGLIYFDLFHSYNRYKNNLNNIMRAVLN